MMRGRILFAAIAAGACALCAGWLWAHILTGLPTILGGAS